MLVERAGVFVGAEIQMIIDDDGELDTLMVNAHAVKNPTVRDRRNPSHAFNCVSYIVSADCHIDAFLMGKFGGETGSLQHIDHSLSRLVLARQNWQKL